MPVIKLVQGSDGGGLRAEAATDPQLTAATRSQLAQVSSFQPLQILDKLKSPTLWVS
jgi:hypothetical protein